MVAAQLDAKNLANVTQYLIRARRDEAPRLSEIHEYVKNRVIDIYIPRKATEEYRQLVEQSRFNILPLLVSSLANSLFIDGYRPKRSAKNAPIWDRVWQPNRMDARQAGLWRSALQYGVSYATVLPGRLGDEESAVITPWSPRRLTALYDDPLNDEWPMYFMTVGFPRPVFADGRVSHVTTVAVYDDRYRYELDVAAGVLDTTLYLGRGQYQRDHLPEIGQIDASSARVSEHGMGFAPAVRFLESYGDLDDGPEGVVAPMLPAQRRLNQTSYGLGMAELYAIWKQKWVTGLEIQEDEDGNPIEPFNLAVDKLLHAEDVDTKFGEFGQTDITPYLSSRDKTLLHIASVRHLRPHSLVVGDAVSNVSAEALAALDAEHGQDLAEHRTAFGEGAEQMLRAAGRAVRDNEAWRDTSAEARWRDTTPRSLAQVADALGKLATLLGVPARALWERIPDVTDQELETWERMAQEDDTFGRLDELLRGGEGAGRGREPADTPAPV